MLYNKFICNPIILFFITLIIGIILLYLSYMGIIKIDNDRFTIVDIGNGIITFAVCSLLFLYLAKIKKWKDFININAKHKSFLFITSNVIWLLMILGIWIYYFYRGSRGSYNSTADTIGIPIMQETTFCLVFLIPLNLFLLIFLRKSSLPTKLFLRPNKYSVFFILLEILFIILILANIISLVFLVIDGDFVSIIVNMSFTYIFLSLRAGKLNYYSYKK